MGKALERTHKRLGISPGDGKMSDPPPYGILIPSLSSYLLKLQLLSSSSISTFNSTRGIFNPTKPLYSRALSSVGALLVIYYHIKFQRYPILAVHPQFDLIFGCAAMQQYEIDCLRFSV
jgi:hypothetical protein